jgi:large subunit ribosomal protein L22
MSALIEETRPGTRAKIRFVRMSASKVRVVLNLVRGKHVSEAIEILSFSERLAAKEVLKVLNSAVANAAHNEEIPEEELFISACFADEGPTLKRFRPRARGRAGRIHKQTCHITIEVRRLTEEEIDELRNRSELKSQSKEKTRGKKSSGGDRAKRVAKSKAAQGETAEAADADDEAVDEVPDSEDVADEGEAGEEE